MLLISKCVPMGVEDAVFATRESLGRHQLSILAEIDMARVLKRSLAFEFRPCLILSTCSLPLTKRAMKVDDTIALAMLCNVAVQERGDGRVEVSVVDPACTLGTINHVELISIARELHSLVRNAIEEIEPLARYHRAA